METALVLVTIIALTSAAAYVTGTRVFGRSPGDLRSVLIALTETVGLVAAFLGLNLALGFVLVRAVWGLTGYFISVYVLEDSTLVLLSALQGFALRWWLDRG